MPEPSSVLIIGAAGGLGHSLTRHYSNLIGASNVYATIRGHPPSALALSMIDKDEEENEHKNVLRDVKMMGGIDLADESVGDHLIKGLEGYGVERGGEEIEVVYVVAGLLKTEKFGESSWKDQLEMYKICAIAPVIIVEALVKNSLLAPNAKIILITSEAGSLSLRTQQEGGGNYGHHGSKAAGNMAGRLLNFDLKEKGINVVMVHPGFLKTQMTKSAGFEQYYEEMGAVSPDEAAKHLASFVSQLDMSMTGKLWAPMGGRGIGNAEAILGKEAAQQTTPLELPW